MQKKIYILIMVLLVLIGIAYVFENPWKENKVSEEHNLLFSRFNKDEVKKIVIKRPNDEEVILTFQDDWKVESSDNYLADQNSVEQILNTISELNSGTIVSTNPEKQVTFEVNPENGRNVLIYNNQNNEILNFFLGKKGSAYGTQYLRVNNSNDVALINQNFENLLDKDSIAWRDMTIFDLDINQVQKIGFDFKNNKFDLEKREDGWFIKEKEVDAGEVKNYLNKITKLKTTSFPKVDQIEKISGKINLTLGEQNYTLIISEEKDNNYLVKRENLPTIFSLTKYLAEQLIVEKGDFEKEE